MILLAVCFLLVSAALSAPHGRVDKQRVMLESLHASGFEYLQTMARYAQLSYCGKLKITLRHELSLTLSFILVTDTTFRDGTCTICNDDVAPLHVNHTIISDDKTMKGFVGVDTLNKVIYISFQGLANAKNLYYSFDLLRQAYPLPGNHHDAKGATVHAGFYNAYISMRHSIFDALLPFLEKYPLSEGYTFHGIGYSLGCPLSTFTALDLVLRYGIDPSKISLTSFGCPRFVNQAMSQRLIDRLGFQRVSRVVHSYDLVTEVIPLLFGYHHFGKCTLSPCCKCYMNRLLVGTEHWIDIESNSTYVCNDMNAAGESPSCANSIPPYRLSLRSHCSYFAQHYVVACAARDNSSIDVGFLPYSIRGC
jgi:hypothetical protein